MTGFAKQRDVDLILLPESNTVLDAVRRLNESSSQILLIVDDSGRLTGTLTDGDIRRCVGTGKPLTTPVSEVCNSSPKVVSSHSLSRARTLMERYGVKRVPVVDEKGMPVSLIFLEDILSGGVDMEQQPNMVVIMAGGRGSRLDPITKIVPKPLLPVGDKPMLELIMESFAKCGFSEFLLSVNYRKDFIKTYLAECGDLPYSISFVEEDTFLGTAGSLALMRDTLNETFFVSNCDILVEVDYLKALKFHKDNENAFTIVGALKKVNVPYGVIRLNEGGFDGIEEKPEVPLIVNTGVYILEPDCIDLIGEDEKLDMPDLIARVREGGGKVGVFPVHRKWIDIGQWGEYKQVLGD